MMKPILKRIVLCADDYGQAEPISAGIIRLVAAGRLSAVSCMVNTAGWLEQAAWLLPFQSQIDIGLHFNLTEGKAVSSLFTQTYGTNLLSLPSLMSRALFRRLQKAAIIAECHAQIDLFERALGCLPRFIDGHQHVHQFAIVRDAVLEVYEKRLNKEACYVRLVEQTGKSATLKDYVKKLIIQFMGTSAFKQQLRNRDIPYTQSFAGIYSFSTSQSYADIFPSFLAASVQDRGMIMCHPALSADIKDDAIAKARYEEYQYFSSQRFQEDCQAQKAILVRFPFAL